MKYTLPRGTKDIIPDEINYWHHVEEVAREIFSLYNYNEIRTPIFESTDLFNRVMGEESDIIKKEMYSFKDKGGRDISLRPEGTAPVARAYISNNLNRNSGETKLFYQGPMFRYERPQAGRYRQFHQMGVERINCKHPYADAAVIAMSYHLFSELGLKNIKILVNTVGSETCRPVLEARIKQFLANNLRNLPEHLHEKFEKNPLKILDSKDPSIETYLSGLPDLREALSQSSRDHFNLVLEYLDNLNIPFEYSSKIVRGLDYYTETVFEVVSEDLGAQSSICGGGRYNNLIKSIGGKDVPAVGFAFGVERVVMLLQEQQIQITKKQPFIYIAPMDTLHYLDAANIAQTLRYSNINCSIEFEKTDLSYSIKQALKHNASYCIIIGDEEVAQKSVTIKNLKKRSQQLVKNDEIIDYFKNEFD
tara:strand:- start:1463 stop:2722 length:1260 start_codon:yes stop_codon:yes gene_type:complete